MMDDNEDYGEMEGDEGINGGILATGDQEILNPISEDAQEE
jgi:hypothetical protein